MEAKLNHVLKFSQGLIMVKIQLTALQNVCLNIYSRIAMLITQLDNSNSLKLHFLNDMT